MFRSTHIAVLLLVALCTTLGAAQTPAAATTFDWTTEESVALFHRYCWDPNQGTECSSGTLRPLADTVLDVVALMSTMPTPTDKDFLLSRNQSRPLAVVLLGPAPDGYSLEGYIKYLIRETSPAIVLAQEFATVAGLGNFMTDADPVGGKIHGAVPVLGFAMNPLWMMSLATGSNATIPASALAYVDSNHWEDAYYGYSLGLAQIMFAGATFAALLHVIVRIIQSFHRNLPMKIFPLTLSSTRPIALWSNLIGVTGRLTFMLVDPMSARFRVSSALSGVIGVFGVPWTIVSAVIAVSAWLYIIRRKINTDHKLVRRYQITGIVFASVIVLLSIMSVVVNGARLNSLAASGQIYFLVYCVSQVFIGGVAAATLFRLRYVVSHSSKQSAGARASVRRLYIRGCVFIASTLAVLLTFALITVPGVGNVPIPSIIDATSIAWALAWCSAAGIELFDYRKKSRRTTMTGSSGSVPSTVSDTNNPMSTPTDQMSSISNM